MSELNLEGKNTHNAIDDVDATVGLRVSEEDERTGLDSTSHGETAYRS